MLHAHLAAAEATHHQALEKGGPFSRDASTAPVIPGLLRRICG
jgi:hypothetical protein